MIRAATTIVEFPELGIGPFTMNRYLFEDLFGVFSVAWYGVIICVGMLLACVLILRNAVKKEGLNTDSFLDYFIAAIPSGIVGARLMYVLANLDIYFQGRTFFQGLYKAIAVWEGGIAIYGAVIAGAIAVLVVAKVKKQNPLMIYDVMAPGLLLAQAIGRWGNFVNGEAHGEVMKNVLPWGMKVNGIGPVHPTFLYESVITFSGFLIAAFLLYRKKKFHGEIFCFYLIWYGIGRTLVEGLRTDSLMIGSLRLAQCIGVLSALAGAVLLVTLLLFRKEGKGAPVEESQGKETAITEKNVTITADQGAVPEEDGVMEKTEDEIAERKKTNKEKTVKKKEDSHGTDH